MSWVIALSLIILGVLCRIQERDRSLGPVLELGVCFPWTTFIFHLLLLFAATTISSVPSLTLWHARLGHASSSWVQQLASRDLLGSVSTKNFDCVVCQLGKQLALPFNISELISTDIFDLIHSDVWGPSFVSSIGGSVSIFCYLC